MSGSSEVGLPPALRQAETTGILEGFLNKRSQRARNKYGRIAGDNSLYHCLLPSKLPPLVNSAILGRPSQFRF